MNMCCVERTLESSMFEAVISTEIAALIGLKMS